MTREEFEKAQELYERIADLCSEMDVDVGQVCFATAEIFMSASVAIGITKAEVMKQLSEHWDEVFKEMMLAGAVGVIEEGALIH